METQELHEQAEEQGGAEVNVPLTPTLPDMEYVTTTARQLASTSTDRELAEVNYVIAAALNAQLGFVIQEQASLVRRVSAIQEFCGALAPVLANFEGMAKKMQDGDGGLFGRLLGIGGNRNGTE